MLTGLTGLMPSQSVQLKENTMIARFAILIGLLLAASASQASTPEKAGPWTGRSFDREARQVGEHRFPKSIDLGHGYHVELRRTPQGRACSRIWVYKYFPDGSLAGDPHAIDTCP